MEKKKGQTQKKKNKNNNNSIAPWFLKRPEAEPLSMAAPSAQSKFSCQAICNQSKL